MENVLEVQVLLSAMLHLPAPAGIVNSWQPQKGTSNHQCVGLGHSDPDRSRRPLGLKAFSRAASLGGGFKLGPHPRIWKVEGLG